MTINLRSYFNICDIVSGAGIEGMVVSIQPRISKSFVIIYVEVETENGTRHLVEESRLLLVKRARKGLSKWQQEEREDYVTNAVSR